jgi:hypothetical protein
MATHYVAADEQYRDLLHVRPHWLADIDYSRFNQVVTAPGGSFGSQPGAPPLLHQYLRACTSIRLALRTTGARGRRVVPGALAPFRRVVAVDVSSGDIIHDTFQGLRWVSKFKILGEVESPNPEFGWLQPTAYSTPAEFP